MLDTRFPRIMGDIGNPDSFDFPVTYRVVEGAVPEAIVLGDTRKWVQAFIRDGKELVAEGCTGLATTCGFLSLVKDDLAQACGVPVASSALEQIPLLEARLPPNRSVGILTISRSSLSPAHLGAAGAREDTPIQGVDGSSFAASILGNADTLNVDAARTELVDAACVLCADRPDIAAIVLECTNMPPYAADIAQATGRSVYSMLTYLNWFQAGLAPRAIKHQL